jgi:hypothetical protein
MSFTDLGNIMSIRENLKIKTATLILIAGVGSVLLAGADNTIPLEEKIVDFQSERIKCYCTEDGKEGLRLQGKNLRKHFKSTGNKVDIYHCGNSNRVLVFLHSDSITDTESTCYASAEQVVESFYACWIKESYIKQKPACKAAQASNLELADEKAQCEQLGTVLGAGACKKEDKD